MKLQITSQNLDHAPDAIRALRDQRLAGSESTAPGSKLGLRRASEHEKNRRHNQTEQDAYMMAIQACLRAGGNPCSDIDMPFRPSA